ncbi:hypothetical protein B296_00029490, partial [Ensete ventricosum]
PARGSHQKAQPLAAWVAASKSNRPGAPTGVGSAHRVAPMEALPSGMALAHKGGACGHSANKSYHPRGNDARPTTGAAALVAKEAACGQGGRWMKVEVEGRASF